MSEGAGERQTEREREREREVDKGETERESRHLKIYLEMYLGRLTLPIGNTVAILICSFVMTGRRLVNFNF